MAGQFHPWGKPWKKKSTDYPEQLTGGITDINTNNSAFYSKVRKKGFPSLW